MPDRSSLLLPLLNRCPVSVTLTLTLTLVVVTGLYHNTPHHSSNSSALVIRLCEAFKSLCSQPEDVDVDVDVR